MKLTKITPLVAAFAIGCALAIGCGKQSPKQPEPIHDQAPPDFTIVCDGNGRFGANWGGVLVIDRDADGIITSRQRALERAWKQYKSYTNSVAEEKSNSNIVWRDCDK